MAEKKSSISQERIKERNAAAVKGLVAMYPTAGKASGKSSAKNGGKKK